MGKKPAAQLQREIVEALSKPKKRGSKKWPLKIYRASWRVPSDTGDWDVVYDVPADNVKTARKRAISILDKSPHYSTDPRDKRVAFGSIEHAYNTAFATKAEREARCALLLKEAHEAVGAKE